jgi:cytochrome c oxidase accessory protein FixG
MNKAPVGYEYGQLYRSEDKIYPREVKGRFASFRSFSMLLLLGMFYGGPWLIWAGRQAVLFDLPARKFYIFGLTMWPQDFIYLALLLIILAVSLFFFTAIAGRVWCGFACPQTVWTEAFTRIERAIEGDRSKRMKLDRGQWTFNRIWRKSAKHFCWIALSLFTGFTFVGYFVEIRSLGGQLVSLTAGPWEWFWVLFYGFATYGNAGFMREQVCKYMCPYARFQSAMFDKDTLVIAYDEERGEPRGARRRSAGPNVEGLGDCIDCTLCVQVCPTGIDIRAGLQYECIACAACIDVCDSVMDKMKYPRGLIRYSTEHAVLHQGYRIVRVRTIVYSLILTALVVSMAWAMYARQPLILDVLRDRNALFRDVGRRGIENSYTLKIVNKHNLDHEYQLSVRGLDGIEIQTETRIAVPAESVFVLPTSVLAPHASAIGGRTIEFVLQSIDDSSIRVVEESRFRGPSGDY